VKVENLIGVLEYQYTMAGLNSLLEVFYSNAVREFVGVSYNGGKVR